MCPPYNPSRVNVILKVTTGYIIPLICLSMAGCEHLEGIGSQPVPVTATAYSSGVACNGVWGGRNAIGGKLRHGEVTSAASDWSKFPLGTKFKVVETGQVYEVDDYGSAMVGKNKVDLFKTNYRDVYQWGVRSVNLEILEWGCWDKSLAVLKPRSRWGHVREMVERLEKRGKRS